MKWQCDVKYNEVHYEKAKQLYLLATTEGALNRDQGIRVDGCGSLGKMLLELIK